MTKHDLLRRIGFSEEYITHLKRLEDNDTYVFEAVGEEYKQQSSDVTNVIVDESINSFTTRLVIHRK